MTNIQRNQADDLFRRLSTVQQDDDKKWGDETEVKRITKGRTYVFKQAVWAAELVEELLEGADLATRMPQEVVASCEAMGFINAQKGGLGVTGGYGYGFLIRKIQQHENGDCTWSPPFFFTVSQTGFGLSGGYQHAQTAMALTSQSAIDRFKDGSITAGSDFGFYSTDSALTGMAAGVLGWKQQRSQNSGFSYSVVKGVYTEYAIHGTRVAPDYDTNSKLYGSTSAEDVLNGLVTRRFPEVKVLTDLLNKLGREAVSAGAALARPSAASTIPVEASLANES